MSMNVLMLESVGSCIDCDGTTYPLQIDGTPDMNMGVHYSDVCEEWLNGLSFDDDDSLNEWVYDSSNGKDRHLKNTFWEFHDKKLL